MYCSYIYLLIWVFFAANNILRIIILNKETVEMDNTLKILCVYMYNY